MLPLAAVCRGQCAASLVQKGGLDRTAPRNVSVTTTASVSCPLDSVSAPLDTREKGQSFFHSSVPSARGTVYSSGWRINGMMGFHLHMSPDTT